jgi:UPF0755 protein
MKNIIKIIITILTLSVILGGCNILKPNETITEETVAKGLEVDLEITEGMALKQIAALLEEKNIIDNGLFFILFVENQGKDKSLRPGTYTLKTGSEYGEVMDMLTQGPVVISYKLAIPEGFTVKQIQQRISEELFFIDNQGLEKALEIENYNYALLNEAESLEGFLFPKTYEVYAEYDAKAIIGMLLAQYQVETSNLDYSFANEKGYSAYDILKIASMIEREAYVPQERELISAVIHNRLDMNMSLGIDATLTYYLDKWDEPLTISDLETDTLYNTRLYSGLPPTPICNPGISAIKAALNPADVDYLYYVVTDPEKGTHTFSKTYEEHNQLIQNANQ